MKKTYLALAFYHLLPLDDPALEVERHKNFFTSRDITCRIYFSHEGINAQMSGEQSDIESYKQFLTSDPRFQSVAFKEDLIAGHIFPRVTVKVRSQLVAFDRKVDMAMRGVALAPSAWRQELEKEEPYLLIDVRNDYESKIGHFDQAICPAAESFREFGDYADQLKESVDPRETKVMMYCTGGIRCEYYSAYMKKLGFEKVYQLEGGIINYGHQEGSKHWKGKLFVFDDRLAVPIDGKEAEPIAQCVHCGKGADTFYNCANMDCNELFISCNHCIEQVKGCCCSTCQSSSRLRLFDPSKGNKPFSRKHLL